MGKNQFEYARDSEEGDGYVFEASFDLQDDGCQDSRKHDKQQLRVIVITHELDPPDIVLDVVSDSTADQRLGVMKAQSLRAVGHLLYGAARLETIKILMPV